ncbi:MAG: hypothetical protein ABS939_00895 [Psychrobacillus sp.]
MSKTKEQLELDQLVNELFEKYSGEVVNSYIERISDISYQDIDLELCTNIEETCNESTNL